MREEPRKPVANQQQEIVKVAKVVEVDNSPIPDDLVNKCNTLDTVGSTIDKDEVVRKGAPCNFGNFSNPKNNVLICERASEYDIVDPLPDPPQIGNFPTLLTLKKGKEKQTEEEAGENSNKETRSGESKPNKNEEEEKVTK